MIGYDPNQLPYFGIWRCYQSGVYVVGLEPSTGITDPAERYHGPGTPNFIEPGEKRQYDLSVSVVAGT